MGRQGGKMVFLHCRCVRCADGQPDTEHARNYWKVLKHRLVKEGNQTVTNCNRLKLRASDGKLRMTDVADTEQLFRIIQSIPSPKASDYLPNVEDKNE